MLVSNVSEGKLTTRFSHLSDRQVALLYDRSLQSVVISEASPMISDTSTSIAYVDRKYSDVEIEFLAKSAILFQKS